MVNTDIRKLDFGLLLALKALLEERNVSRAAERLALTQPTVSGMLSRLRKIFNDPLFVRTQHGVIPTKRAESLRAPLDQILRDADQLITPEAFDPESAEIDFRISVNDYMQSALVVPYIGSLRCEAPGVRLAVSNLEIAELEPKLARGEIDLAITTRDFVSPSLKTQFLYREEYVCVVRKAHPIRSRRVSMERLLAHDHVLVSPTSGRFSGPVDDVLSERGVKRRVALSVPNFLVLLEALETDDLIAFVPRQLLAGHRGGLRVIRPPFELPGFDVIAAWHARVDSYPPHRWLRERLEEQATELS